MLKVQPRTLRYSSYKKSSLKRMFGTYFLGFFSAQMDMFCDQKPCCDRVHLRCYEIYTWRALLMWHYISGSMLDMLVTKWKTHHDLGRINEPVKWSRGSILCFCHLSNWSLDVSGSSPKVQPFLHSKKSWDRGEKRLEKWWNTQKTPKSMLIGNRW